MSLIERLAVVALRQFDPELAHGLAMKALELGLATFNLRPIKDKHSRPGSSKPSRACSRV